MPHVLEDPDILEEHITLSPACDELDTLSRALPSFRPKRTPVLAWLGRLFTSVPRLGPRQQGYCAPRAPRFETPLDILAREHPDVLLRVMSSIS
jgi:hypothetical protein